MVCDNLTDDDNATKLKQELRAISAKKNIEKLKQDESAMEKIRIHKNELLHKK